MKNLFVLIKFFLFLFCSGTLCAQNNENGYSHLPLKVKDSPAFGKDVVINDQPTQDQQKVAICSAFNGWLFAAVTYKDPLWGSVAVVSVMKSMDNGQSWSLLLNGWWPGGGDTKFTSVGILATGNTVENLKFILALVAVSSSTGIGTGFVRVFNAGTGAYESELCADPFCYDIALASDGLYPASNANPHSIGVLYSKSQFNLDSLIFTSSSNGGVSLDNRHGVATTGGRFHKVALTYGRSPSWATGRYFAAWEEQDDYGSMPGRIYTAHSEPNFNSPFTAPVRLDVLDPANDNLCMNPAIACQSNNLDNDSSNLTEIVFFERLNPSMQLYDIKGYYNLQAASHAYFRALTATDPAHSNSQPDITFNPYDSTFMLTYYDSTLQKLPLLTKHFNLNSPDQWKVVSTGYNDSSNLRAPYPKVEVFSDLQKGANVWIANGNDGNGVAMFDSPSHVWPGVSEISNGDGTMLLSAYPNPCTTTIKIAFKLGAPDKVTIRLFDILGQPAGIITSQPFCSGNHVVQYNVANLPPGSYLYSFRSGSFSSAGKFSVTR